MHMHVSLHGHALVLAQADEGGGMGCSGHAGDYAQSCTQVGV